MPPPILQVQRFTCGAIHHVCPDSQVPIFAARRDPWEQETAMGVGCDYCRAAPPMPDREPPVPVPSDDSSNGQAPRTATEVRISRPGRATLVDVGGQVDGPADDMDDAETPSADQKEMSSPHQNEESSSDQKNTATDQKEKQSTDSVELTPEQDVLVTVMTRGLEIAARDVCWAQHFCSTKLTDLRSQERFYRAFGAGEPDGGYSSELRAAIDVVQESLLKSMFKIRVLRGAEG